MQIALSIEHEMQLIKTAYYGEYLEMRDDA